MTPQRRHSLQPARPGSPGIPASCVAAVLVLALAIITVAQPAAALNLKACGTKTILGVAVPAGLQVDLDTNEDNCGACAKSCAAGQECCGGACVGLGKLQVTMTWSRNRDADLYVKTPSGGLLNTYTRGDNGSAQYDFGRFDVDDAVGTGPENVYWPPGGNSPTAGEYHVCGVLYEQQSALWSPPASAANPVTLHVTITGVPGSAGPLSYTSNRTSSEFQAILQDCTRNSTGYIASFTIAGRASSPPPPPAQPISSATCTAPIDKTVAAQRGPIFCQAFGAGHVTQAGGELTVSTCAFIGEALLASNPFFDVWVVSNAVPRGATANQLPNATGLVEIRVSYKHPCNPQELVFTPTALDPIVKVATSLFGGLDSLHSVIVNNGTVTMRALNAVVITQRINNNFLGVTIRSPDYGEAANTMCSGGCFVTAGARGITLPLNSFGFGIGLLNNTLAFGRRARALQQEQQQQLGTGNYSQEAVQACRDDIYEPFLSTCAFDVTYTNDFRFVNATAEMQQWYRGAKAPPPRPPSPAPTPPTPPPPKGSSSKTGIIAGVVVGVACAAIAAGIVLFCVVRRCNQARRAAYGASAQQQQQVSVSLDKSALEMSSQAMYGAPPRAGADDKIPAAQQPVVVHASAHAAAQQV